MVWYLVKHGNFILLLFVMIFWYSAYFIAYVPLISWKFCTSQASNLC